MGDWRKFLCRRLSLHLFGRIAVFVFLLFGGFAAADTIRASPDEEIRDLLSKIGFNEISFVNCVLEAGIDQPQGGLVSRFEFNINLTYLNFAKTEIIESSSGDELLYTGIIRFGEKFGLNERLRREFRWYVKDKYFQDWALKHPPLFGENYQQIESDLQKTGIAQDTFYRFNDGRKSQTFPYFLYFDFVYSDRNMISTLFYTLEALARSNKC